MKAVVFLILLWFCLIVSAVVWSNFVDGKLYNCTDSIPFGFIHPGDWVHGPLNIPIKEVDEINPNDSMSVPDTIKKGWSIDKLWILWWSFNAASVFVSGALSLIICRLLKSEIERDIQDERIQLRH